MARQVQDLDMPVVGWDARGAAGVAVDYQGAVAGRVVVGCCYSQTQAPDGSYPRHPASNPSECQAPGYYFDPQDCQSCPLLWHALGNEWSRSYSGDDVAFRSLSIVTTTIFDIRYYLLVNSEVGRNLLEVYDRYAPSILPQVQDDPALMRRITASLLDAVAFAQDMLRLHTVGGSADVAGRVVFDREKRDTATALLRDLRAAVPPESGATLLLDVAQRFLDDTVGHTSAEVLAAMRVRPFAEAAGSAPPDAAASGPAAG